MFFNYYLPYNKKLRKFDFVKRAILIISLDIFFVDNFSL